MKILSRVIVLSLRCYLIRSYIFGIYSIKRGTWFYINIDDFSYLSLINCLEYEFAYWAKLSGRSCLYLISSESKGKINFLGVCVHSYSLCISFYCHQLQSQIQKMMNNTFSSSCVQVCVMFLTLKENLFPLSGIFLFHSFGLKNYISHLNRSGLET